MRKYLFFLSIVFLFCLSGSSLHAQDAVKVSTDGLNYPKIYALCLDANVSPVLDLLQEQPKEKLSPKDTQFKAAFEQRFKYRKDKSKYLAEHASEIDALLKVFQAYWRKSLLNPKKDFTTSLETDLISFIEKYCPPAHSRAVEKDSVDNYIKRYLARKGYHTTNGIGKTGRLYDLLVWKTQKDTTYTFDLKEETISARVVLMDDFITLGWEEYATFNKYTPGGWATQTALYCVRKAYDLQSENFLVKYLAHEGRHFSDMNTFPKLSSTDLEYRAKLTELSMAKKELYNLINFFLKNANYDSQNAHSVANYCVIRDLSKVLFGREFEGDMTKWKALPEEKLNETAFAALQQNTKALHQAGPTVERYLKP